MKKHWWKIAAAFALGIALALLVSPQALLAALGEAALALGAWLRALSLSGSAGNAAAWAICLILSLLPVLFILTARRRRRLPGDALWPLAALGLFGGLYVLINPTASRLFIPAAADASFMRFAALLPMGAALSLLLACALLRWVGGLTDEKLIFWMRALLLTTMLLVSLLAGYSIASSVTAPASIPLAALALLPDIFLLRLLEAARSLLAAMREGWYRAESERSAQRVAELARQTLIAAICCAAARNVLALLLGPWLSDISVTLSLPLTEMALSCAALLLSRGMAAACRVQRENELMI